MVIVFPYGLLCVESNEQIIRSGKIKLNIFGPNDRYYFYPGTGVDSWTRNDYITLSTVFNKSAGTFTGAADALKIYSSMSAYPSSDYAQKTPASTAETALCPNTLDVMTLRSYGALRFYPTYKDKSFYVRISFTNTVYGAQVTYQYYRSGNLKGSVGVTVEGTQTYYNSPYRGQIRVYSFIPWKSVINGWSYIGGCSNTITGKYWFSSTDYANGIDCDLQPRSSDSWWSNWIGDFEPEIPDDEDPYWEGGTSGEDGGGGNFSEDSDDVDEDALPDIDAIGTGFATIFTPTKAQLTALADVMWDNGVFQALQNLVENISGMFTSLAIVPFEVTQGATVEANFLGLFQTGIFLTLAAKQYYEFDMGSINLADDARIFTSGSALDYSPFSKLGIFLPFIGFQDLDIDECRDNTLSLKYRIDILSGTCVALISVGGNPIYQFTGNCLSQIPITNESMQSLVTDAVQVGIAAAATHSASGAASADMTAAEGEKNAAVKEAKMAHAEAHIASSQGRLASATANAAMGMKPTFGKAGAISAAASLLAVKQPYLFLTTPRQSLPDRYQKYCGFPSNITGKLNTFSGFTVVEDIRLNGLVATSPEVSEIYQLLKSGVII